MVNNAQGAVVILRRKEVEARTGLSRSTIYSRIARGTFPAPVPLGEKAVGWVEREIDNYLAACVARRDSTLQST